MSSSLVKSESETHTGCFSDAHLTSTVLTYENLRRTETGFHAIDIIVTDEDDLAKNNIIATTNINVLNNSTSEAEGTVTYFGIANSHRERDENGLFSALSRERSTNQEFLVRYTVKSPNGLVSDDRSITTSADKCQISTDRHNQMPCIDRSNSCTRLLPADDASQTIRHSPQSSVFMVDSADGSSNRSCIYQDVSSQTDDFSAVEVTANNKDNGALTTQGSAFSFIIMDTTHDSTTSSKNEKTVVMREDDIDLALIFLPHMVGSCIAMWCCGCLFGCIGFALAVFGSRVSNEGDHVRAKRLSRASLACAVLGVVTGLLAVILLLFAVLGVFGENYIIGTSPSPLPTQPPLRPPFF